MNEKIKEWHQRMDQVTNAFKSFPVADFNKKINRESWSIAQVTDHLIRINRSYYATFDAVQSGEYKVQIHGKLGFLTRAMGKMIVKSVEPSRQTKIQTFSIWQPGNKQFSIDLIDAFAKEQEQMKLWMEQILEISAMHQPISSPANKLIIYPIAAAFEIIVTHEERHLAQAQEILSELNALKQF